MITGIVIGGEAAVARFERMPGKLRDELKKGIARATLLVQRQSKEQKLSGQVLNVRTGRLRRSINTRVTEQATEVTGIVGTNVKYARPHEYGFHGIVSVRAHLRTSKLGGVHEVKQHAREMNVKERSFLRSALADERQAIRSEFEKATQRALR